MARGRPPGQMTPHRQRVLAEITVRVALGINEPPNLAQLARRCGLYDYREARRIVRDLKRLQAI